MTKELSDGDKQFIDAIKSLKENPDKKRITEARGKYSKETVTRILEHVYQGKIDYFETEEKHETGYARELNRRNKNIAKVNLLTLRKYGLDTLLKTL